MGGVSALSASIFPFDPSDFAFICPTVLYNRTEHALIIRFFKIYDLQLWLQLPLLPLTYAHSIPQICIYFRSVLVLIT